jgi:hypothetical protein
MHQPHLSPSVPTIKMRHNRNDLDRFPASGRLKCKRLFMELGDGHVWFSVVQTRPAVMNLSLRMTILPQTKFAILSLAKRAPTKADGTRIAELTVEFSKQMTELKDKIKIALDESRMLILGTQVLLGFQLRSAFEPAFDRLPNSAQYLKMTGLMILLLAIGLIMAPGSYHRIVRAGNDAEDVHQFATTMMDLALIPFLLAFAIDVYTSIGRIVGTTGGLIGGSVTGATCVFFWYGFGWLSRSGRGHRHERSTVERTPLKTKIDQALTEARVVLPGAQALLGFQLVTTFMDGFDKLPGSSKFIHLASLALIALTTILLMTPAAYHRIAERGEDTQRVHKVASASLMAAMVTLPLAIAADVYVVIDKVTNSIAISVACAVLALAFFYGTWFGYTTFRRAQIRRK